MNSIPEKMCVFLHRDFVNVSVFQQYVTMVIPRYYNIMKFIFSSLALYNWVQAIIDTNDSIFF
jgi:hypothetical protein